jgi:hypothetical protein
MVWVLLLHLATSTTIECMSDYCWLFNGDEYCDLPCMNQLCDFDSATPSDNQASDCYYDCIDIRCQSSLLGDGVCDSGKV